MENSSIKVDIQFLPWTSSGYKIRSIRVKEKIGGDIPHGVVELMHPDSESTSDLILSEKSGILKIIDERENGCIYEIPIFITDRTYYKNTASFSFICIKDPRFYTEVVSESYLDITDALRTIYPGKTDLRVESDINNSVPVYQACETTYNFCTRLALSWKRESIFAYGLDGFFIKEPNGRYNSFGETKPLPMTNSMMQQITPYVLCYNKLSSQVPYDPWTEGATKTDYSKYPKLKYAQAQMFFSEYRILGTDYVQLEENRRYNQKSYASQMSRFTVSSNIMPNYKLGDTLEYKDMTQETQVPFTIFLVESNELFFAGTGEVTDEHGLSFSWTSELLGLEDGKWGVI